MKTGAAHPREEDRHAGASTLALRAELSRIWTLPWTPLILTAATLLVLGPAVLDVRVFTSDADGPGGRPLAATTGLALAVVALMVLAAVVIASGLRCGELRVAASAVPRRTSLAAAQLGALSLVALTASAALFGIDAVVRTWTNPPAPGLLDPSRLQAGPGFCATAITFTLLCAASTLVVRNAIVPVAVLVLTPLLLFGWLETVAPAVLAALPYAASRAALQGQAETSTALTAPGGFLVLVVWSTVSAIVFTATLVRRDL